MGNKWDTEGADRLGKHKGQDRAGEADLGQVSGWQGGKSGGRDKKIVFCIETLT